MTLLAVLARHHRRATLTLSGTFANATVGTAYSSDLTISGGDGSYSNARVTVGTLPTWATLSIVSNKLRLSGTPTGSATTVNITVAVDSGDGQTATSAQIFAVAESFDPLWSYVTSMSNCKAIDYVDEKTGIAWTGTSKPNISTAAGNPFDPAGSAYFFLSSDLKTTTPLLGGSGDWCVEAWTYQGPNHEDRTWFDSRSSSTQGVGGYLGLWSSLPQGLYPTLSNNTAILGSASSPITANQWAHVAMFKISGTVYGAINGVIVFSVVDARTLVAPPIFCLGQNYAGGQSYTGYLGGWRITEGNARYSSSGFTPPTERFAAA